MNSIHFNSNTGIFKLDTPHTSYCMGILDRKYLAHLYYGKRLGSDDLSYLMEPLQNEAVPSVLPAEKGGFLDYYPSEYGFSGTGDFREAAISVISSQGQEGCELLYRGYRILDEKKPLAGLPSTFPIHSDTVTADTKVTSSENHSDSTVQTLEIDLEDPILHLLVTLSYSVYTDVDAIARSVRVTNEGKVPLRLNRCLSLCLDMENEDFDMVDLTGAWAREHEAERRHVGYGGTVTESIRGIPGHDANPFYALVSHETAQEFGNAYGFLFIYSGSFLGKVERTQFDKIRAVLGIHPEKFSWKLGAGETFQAPEAVLVYSADGIGGMTRTFHDLIRNHLIRSKWQFAPRPVLVNNWEATYFDFDEQKLLEIAAKAREAGIDMLVCDDGWYGTHRNSPSGCLGDWTEDSKKFPEGFAAFTRKLHDMGLKSGLWFEPEMISEDSELYRQHPDWVQKLSDRTPTLTRDQWVLDLSNEEVVDYVIQAVESMIRRTGIDYIKWDLNRPLIDLGSRALPADRQGEISHRHVLAVYRIQETILQDFPDLLIENCAGGGSRFDAGMLYYSPQIWCSDDMDPMERLKIQEGTEMVYPISCMGAHVGASPYGITSRTSDFDSRALCAMIGTFGYELDLTRLSETDFQKIHGQVALYKKLQPLIQRGDYFRIASYAQNGWLDCVEIVTKDKTTAMALVVQVLTQPNQKAERLYFCGLDPERIYEIDGQSYHGDILMQAGYLLPHEVHDFYARMILIQS